MFNISLNLHDNSKVNYDLEGKITIEDFEEKIFVTIDDWKITDYIKQWKNACKSLEKKQNSAFITTYIKTDNHCNEIWPAFYTEKGIFIQNRVIPQNSINPFEPNNLAPYINNFYTDNEDEDKLSTWKTNLESINDFKKRLNI